MSPPRKRPDIVESLSGTECFLYDGDGQSLTVLNAAALFIWSLCDGEHDESTILAVMRRIYPAPPPDILATDIRRTLDGFAQRGLLAE